MKPLDALAIIIVITLIVLSFLLISQDSGSTLVSIQTQDKQSLYPLDTNRVITAQGPLGDTIIEIKDNSVSVLDSPCPNHNCIYDGAIQKAGSTLACLPNRVLVTIVGSQEVNSVSY